MQGLSSFLERFKKFGLPDETIRKEAVAVVLEILGENVDIKNITVKEGVLTIDVHPVFKNELFMKRKRILTELSKRLGAKAPGKLR